MSHSSEPSSSPTEICAQAKLIAIDGNSTWSENSDDPIEIIAHDSASVTFQVNQVWSSDENPVNLLSTFYSRDEDVNVCQGRASVAPGLLTTYTAICSYDEDKNGYTSNVILYLQDDQFTTSDNAVVPSDCNPTGNSGKAVAYTFELPCDCPEPPAEEETSTLSPTAQCDYQEINFDQNDYRRRTR